MFAPTVVRVAAGASALERSGTATAAHKISVKRVYPYCSQLNAADTSTVKALVECFQRRCSPLIAAANVLAAGRT